MYRRYLMMSIRPKPIFFNADIYETLIFMKQPVGYIKMNNRSKKLNSLHLNSLQKGNQLNNAHF